MKLGIAGYGGDVAAQLEAGDSWGAVGRVRPRAYVALRQPTARLGEKGRAAVSSAGGRQWRPEGTAMPSANREEESAEEGGE
jgi:hypothetical protein